MLFSCCPFFLSVLWLIKGINIFPSDCAKRKSAETNHALLQCMFSHSGGGIVRRKKGGRQINLRMDEHPWISSLALMPRWHYNSSTLVSVNLPGWKESCYTRQTVPDCTVLEEEWTGELTSMCKERQEQTKCFTHRWGGRFTELNGPECGQRMNGNIPA